MAEMVNIPKSNSDTAISSDSLAKTSTSDSSASLKGRDSPSLSLDTPPLSSSPPSPGYLSRNESFSTNGGYQDDWESFPPLERLTVFDILDNLALPQRLERWQNRITVQTEKVRRHREKLKSSGLNAKDRVVEEWRRRLPPPDEQLDKYRKRMRESVDRLGTRWNDTKAVTLREKVSFIAGVLNVFISGYLIGAHPNLFYYWFTAQLCYFMPIRYYTYHKRGYHYFLADMCYFVNLLLLLTIWVAPQSKRLFISTYCLANGNNAVAIAMWRNSMVFHSLDKVTSSPDSPEHYGLLAMMGWASLPYAIWQLSYHFLITVRRREKIAAGRPTSFTWLRKSYANTWIGRLILSLPNSLHEPAFMLTHAGFLLTMFVWSIHNGATYYIDVFGKRFQNELEQLKKDVAKWQTSPESLASPITTPKADNKPSIGQNHTSVSSLDKAGHRRTASVDQIPMLDSKNEGATGIEGLRKR
ncbi:glycerophosphocholine acyltransferase 1 [Physcia stellaris]|nr:glycerophosphocholine acyltransferase 1 [Physcia stellaris]